MSNEQSSGGEWVLVMKPYKIPEREGWPAHDITTEVLREMAEKFSETPVEDSFGRWEDPRKEPSVLASATQACVREDGALYLKIDIPDTLSERDLRLVRNHTTVLFDPKHRIILDVAVDATWCCGVDAADHDKPAINQ